MRTLLARSLASLPLPRRSSDELRAILTGPDTAHRRELEAMLEAATAAER